MLLYHWADEPLGMGVRVAYMGYITKVVEETCSPVRPLVGAGSFEGVAFGDLVGDGGGSLGVDEVAGGAWLLLLVVIVFEYCDSNRS